MVIYTVTTQMLGKQGIRFSDFFSSHFPLALSSPMLPIFGFWCCLPLARLTGLLQRLHFLHLLPVCILQYQLCESHVVE